jgi:hypothetical protein
VLKSVPANCQLPCNLKNILDFVLDVQVKGFKIWTWVLLQSMDKLGFIIKIVMESLQHVLKMYAWSLSENQASVKFRCTLIELFLKQSLFRKHDFAICVYKLYLGCRVCHGYVNTCGVRAAGMAGTGTVWEIPTR